MLNKTLSRIPSRVNCFLKFSPDGFVELQDRGDVEENVHLTPQRLPVLATQAEVFRLQIAGDAGELPVEVRINLA